MKKLGLYIHIPFCKSKCLYCDFTTMPYQDKRIEEYFELLKDEIELYNDYKSGYEVDTIYLGGGTPSYVESNYIVGLDKLIKEKFNLVNDLEYTIEMNPETINEAKLKDYKNIGINRVSLGVQTFNDNLLKTLGRNHSVDTSLKDIKLLRKNGFNNINLDLMMGLPNQNIDNIKKDLEYVKKIKPEHISWYGLIVEENTRFNKLQRENKLFLPKEEDERKFYHEIIEILSSAGINQYEISNFSKDGFQSKHNLKYWHVEEYLGFGIGASGYVNKKRYSNLNKYNDYKNMVLSGKKPIIIEENLINEDMIFEKIIMNMRLKEGLNILELRENYNYDILENNKELIENYIELELLVLKNSRLSFTEKGFNISNKFFVDIII